MAQTVALDWTKTDCDGVMHQLYSELNEGKVIVQEYVMPPTCGGCWQAAQAIAPVIDDFGISHPGRVKFYATGYNNAFTCAMMQTWKTAYGLTPDVFINGASEVSYYGGMGMPTVVVLGGGYGHGVYGKWIGFGAWLIEDLRDSITVALDAANTIEEVENPGFSLFPSPASTEVNIVLNGAERIANVQVMDLSGHVVAERTHPDVANVRMDTSTLAAGAYIVRVTTTSGSLLRSPFQVTR